MPTALFVYVFTAKQNPSGQLTLESPFKSTVKRNPERLAQAGLVPSITRRNVTFKASFHFNKGELKARDLKIIQQEVDRELRHEVSIGRSYRIWQNAFVQIPSLKENKALRDGFLQQIGAKADEAQLKYHELMTTGKISGTTPSESAAPSSVAEVQKAVQDDVMEWGGGPEDSSVAQDQVSAVITSGEGSFIGDDADSDELAGRSGGVRYGWAGWTEASSHNSSSRFSRSRFSRS